ncbi:MAG: domain S-box/diguanylate cyclase protein [Rhodocyclaceae bacterium]|nr:domain S-box/diguanylate cyclase protein [Rhodocyclaceae bacterium]
MQPTEPVFSADKGTSVQSADLLSDGDANQRHLALLLEAQRIGRIGNWERDLRTKQVWWSDECYRLFGYEPGSIRPSYSLFLQHVHPDDRQRVAGIMAVNRDSNAPYDVEYRGVTTSGELRHFVNHGRVLIDDQGTMLRASGTIQDITARKQIEARFIRQHAYLKAVLDNMPQGISVFDEELKLRVWNQGFLDVLELPPEAVYEGVSFADLIRIPAQRGEYGPGDPEEHVKRLNDLALQFHPHRLERVRPGGRTHLTHGQPLYIDDRIAGFITTYTEITEQKAAEEVLRREHDLLQTVVDNIPSGITLLNRDLELVLYNREVPRLLGMPEDLFNQGTTTLEDLLRFNAKRGEYGPGDEDCIVSAMMARARNPVAHHFERTRPNGLTLDIRGAPLADGSMVTVYTDITAHKRNEERLQLADKVFAHSPAGIVIADDEHRILSVNPAFTAMTGLEPFEVVGYPVSSLPSAATDESWNQLASSLAHRGNWSGEMEAHRKNGEAFIAGITVSRVGDPEHDQTTHYIWMFADITERKRAEERVRHMAQTDPLTGLPNRLALLMRLAQILPEGRRHSRSVAVMFIDLDRFKIINDTLGHQVGDDLLREVASRLACTVRESDTVARLGGDEFVVVLPDVASATDSAIVAGKIITALAVPIRVEGHDLHTSPSIGISLFPADGQDGDTILKNADTAMYHAKAAGRNNYQFYADEMNRAATERLDLESKLRQALSRNELALAYQPQFEARTRRVTGVEALLRWHHPVDGIISPARFVPIAEETGLIVAIGDWVLHNACREVKRWMDAGLPPLRVAVNVSARQLRRRDFCETVAGALADSGLPPEQLELEITESSVMENAEEAIGILQGLRRMGVTLAIDDFGTGYSSLAYLKLFPIDHLKIDRSFVADIEHDLNDRAIALGTIALARSLGLNVIAEGVETEDQLELLRDNGCDEVQGYLLSQPLHGAAAFAFLHAQTTTG